METQRDSAEKEKLDIYELAFHLDPTLAETDLTAETGKIRTLVEKYAPILAEEAPKLRHFAYAIVKKVGSVNKKFTTGAFGWMKFEAPTGYIPELKKSLDPLDSIVRFLLIKTVRESTLVGNKLLVQLRGDGRDRDREERPVRKMVKEEKKPIDSAELDKKIEEMVKE